MCPMQRVIHDKLRVFILPACKFRTSRMVAGTQLVFKYGRGEGEIDGEEKRREVNVRVR